MTKEEYDAIMDRMKTWAGCASCQSYNGVRCRACAWADAMDCVDAFYEDNAPDERDKRTIAAMLNCTEKPQCKDCPWTECGRNGEGHIEIPESLAKAMHELLTRLTEWTEQ